jgi:hypothetical protein
MIDCSIFLHFVRYNFIQGVKYITLKCKQAMKRRSIPGLMEFKQWIIIKFPMKEGLNTPHEIRVLWETHFDEKVDVLQIIRVLMNKVRWGREYLQDEHRSGRPPLDDIDVAILCIIDTFLLSGRWSLRRRSRSFAAQYYTTCTKVLNFDHFIYDGLYIWWLMIECENGKKTHNRWYLFSKQTPWTNENISCLETNYNSFSHNSFAECSLQRDIISQQLWGEIFKPSNQCL